MQIFGRARRWVIFGSLGYQRVLRVPRKHIRCLNRNDIERCVDIELKARMRRSQGCFDRGGGISTGENESRVACALWEWYEFLTDFCGDHNIIDAVDSECLFDSGDG